ncbi:hypothetical protein D3874_05470 [Oleomonas cavernae]|uniref:Uncharacterized protein n=1 Tax=Oleomonas cavernae TaxID=2320859 RepID=A0A418W965_9PROT|nr:hypothetical protein [Oleomonas cavernae]RJF86538.1 hypothetical protein D3874_05470 [Oleomonas cavernae]
MTVPGSMVEAHERFRLCDVAQAEVLLRDLFDGEQFELVCQESDGLVLTLHRFRLNGIPAFAVHCGSGLELVSSGRRYLGCIGPRRAFEIDGQPRPTGTMP